MTVRCAYMYKTAACVVVGSRRVTCAIAHEDNKRTLFVLALLIRIICLHLPMVENESLWIRQLTNGDDPFLFQNILMHTCKVCEEHLQ